MSKLKLYFLPAISLGMLLSAFSHHPPAQAGELKMSGNISGEARLFTAEPMYAEQKHDSYSAVAEPEFYYDFGNSKSFTVTPFARVDSADKKRTHADLRDAFFMTYGDDWEIRVGLDKVFWGVTEFAHLVDIINQTDAVEGFDGEDKLGQPMVMLSLIQEFGTLDFFVLPYFRERTFTGKGGRLRFPILVDDSNPIYESSKRERQIDFAVRYRHTMGGWDIGLSHFRGTSREPTLLLRVDAGGQPVFTPYYEQINQTGLDLQYIRGELLWKLESIYRAGQGGQNYYALQGGFEYSFYALFDSKADISLLTEIAWDERGDNAVSAYAYNHDVMLGARLAFNDISSTELLFGFSADYKNGSNSILLEGNRRFGDNWKMELQSYYFLHASASDYSYQIRNDDFIQLTLSYYY